MLASALNFAIGFFGYPFEGQYQQSITLEAPHVRSTILDGILFELMRGRAPNISLTTPLHRIRHARGQITRMIAEPTL